MLLVPFAVHAQKTDTVLAEVGREKITEADVIFRYQTLPAQVKQKNKFADVRKQLLEQLVLERLFAIEARSLGIDKEKQVQEAVKRTENTILHQAFIQSFAIKNVTDADIQREYDAYAANYSQGAEYRARHILVKTEAEGNDLVSKLDKGNDFTELAKTYSTGPSAPRGGDLGYFREGQMVKPFENAVKLLDTGKYTKKPVQTNFGWHVIKLEDKRQADVPPLEELKGKLRQAVADAKLQKHLTELRSKYKVKIK